MSIAAKLGGVDLFKRAQKDGDWVWDNGTFVGRPFHLDFSTAQILVSDSWKEKAQGIPQGCFLLAYYDCDPGNENLEEALLLRVREPAALPTERDVVGSMVEYYKENIRTGNTSNSKLDQFTRYDFSFSGLSCSILGCFYKEDGKLRFGADVENFFSAHNYSVIKPSSDLLKFIVNYREDGAPGGVSDIRIGNVRYSSSRRFQASSTEIPVYVKAADFAGKRSGLFGMTRTGKSNTIKKVIQANEQISSLSQLKLDMSAESSDQVLKPFTNDGTPKYPIGQIVFDMNGEYANANLQDAGTAIFDLYQDKTIRYSIVEKSGFKVLKVNFFNEVDNGFELIKSHPKVADDSSRFMSNFRSILLEKPTDYDTNNSAKIRYDRRIAVYFCILKRAGFTPPAGMNIKFKVNAEVRNDVDSAVDPSVGISFDDAITWWETFWKIYDQDPNGTFLAYKNKSRKEWADDDLKSLLVMLTRCRSSGGAPDCSGYLALRELNKQHTHVKQAPFEVDILANLREGNIVIVDLSSGEEDLQRMYSERITRYVFRDSMQRFTSALPNNFIQFYFEEAHNLFPKQADKDLSQIYNRLAKEGAKLHLGLVFATQELSSISGNILKNTQNWFISHLNNADEIRELKKYYDFSDFGDSLLKFSQETDKGFARVKTYSNAFVIPMQIDRFAPEK
jgi:hypothetical protein